MKKLDVKYVIKRLALVIMLLAIIIVNNVSMLRADEIDDILIHLIVVESNGNPNAVSSAGAVGLCQITPIVLREYNQINIKKYTFYNGLDMCEMVYPDINKEVALWYLRRLRDWYLKDFIMQIPCDGFKGKIHITKSWKNKNGILHYPLQGTFTITTLDFPNIQSFEDYKLALILAAYNGGITRLRKNNYDINKMPRETKSYVRKIMKLYKEEK